MTMPGGSNDRVWKAIEDLDLVGAAEIARRGGVSRTTVMRWRLGDGGGRPVILPPPHIRIGEFEYWSWRLLSRNHPERFPRHECPPGRAGVGQGSGRAGRR
ncbi:MAG: hypothetical protein ACRDVM_09300 [Acidimicrobiia bacterium]